MKNGVLSHHIRESEEIEKRRKALVHKERCEECPLRKFCGSTCVFRVMENENRKKILEEKVKGRTNTEIAHLLDVHKSTVTYHMEELREEGIVNEEAVELLRSEGVL